MAKILVLGAGSVIRGDDGVGIRAARGLREILGVKQGLKVEIKELEHAHINILDVLEKYDKLIIVDAVMSDKVKPGHVRRITFEDIKAKKSAYSSHQMGLPRILEMAQALKLRMPKEIVVFAVAIRSADFFSDKLSAEVEAKLPRIVGLLRKEVG